MNTNEATSQLSDDRIPLNQPPSKYPKKELEPTPWSWAKTHKKELVLTAIGIAATLGVAYGIKNKAVISELLPACKADTKQAPKITPNTTPVIQVTAPTVVLELVESKRPYTRPTEPFEVTCHIRDLAEGFHHSTAKALQALEMGIDLPENQTIVNSYLKYAA